LTSSCQLLIERREPIDQFCGRVLPLTPDHLESDPG
jgi:hypothetical protein